LVRAVIDFKVTEAAGKYFLTPYLTLVQLLEKRALSRADRALNGLDAWTNGAEDEECDEEGPAYEEGEAPADDGNF
jgi:hypothetical protein